MEVRMVKMLNPTAEADEAEISLASPIHDLNGKVIGFVYNGWWSLKVALKRLEELLNQRYKPAEFIWIDKQGSKPIPDEVIEELANKADLVICGLGN